MGSLINCSHLQRHIPHLDWVNFPEAPGHFLLANGQGFSALPQHLLFLSSKCIYKFSGPSWAITRWSLTPALIAELWLGGFFPPSSALFFLGWWLSLFFSPSVHNKKQEVKSLPSVPMSSYPSCSDWSSCPAPLSCCWISHNTLSCQKMSQPYEGQIVCHKEGWRLGLFKVYEWLSISFWLCLSSLSFIECEKLNTDLYTFERLEYSWPLYILSLVKDFGFWIFKDKDIPNRSLEPLFAHL